MTIVSPILARTCVATLSLVGLVLTGAHAADAENIVVNGTFETPLTDGWKVSGDPRMATVQKEDGNQFLRIQTLEPTYCNVVQKFPVGEDWKGLQVTARIRVADLQKGPESHNTATLLYSFEDASGEHVGEWSQSMILKDQDWTEVAGQVSEIPPGAVTLVVTCAMMNAAGKADFDDIVVTPAK